jgi:BMFP domain-containing protein YqiC
MEKEDKEFREKLTTKVSNLLNQLEVFNRDLDKNESVDVQGLALISARNKLDTSLKELKLLHAQRKEERTKLELEVKHNWYFLIETLIKINLSYRKKSFAS